MRRHHGKRRRPELTALIDVLFILLFAALVSARSSAEQQVARQVAEATAHARAGRDAGVRDPDTAADAGRPPAADAAPAADAGPAADAAGATPRETEHTLRSRRLAAALARAVQDKDVYVVEVSAAGRLVAITPWIGGVAGERAIVDRRLLRQVPPEESDIELAYRGEDFESQQICMIVAEHIDAPARDLDQSLILITADAPLADLPLALRDGLTRDSTRCYRTRGLAVLLDPPADSADPLRGTHGIEDHR